MKLELRQSEVSIKNLPTSRGFLTYRLHDHEAPSAAAVHLHGIESHSGWYSELASHLQSGSMTVCCFDRAGSGLSSGERGDIPSWRNWVNDARAMVEHVRTKHPDLPVYLIGSCWGAKVALQLAVSEPQVADGLILISPALRMRVGFTPLEAARIAISYIFAPERQFPVPIAREEMFSSVPGCVEFIRTDSLRLKAATARFFVQTRRLDRRNNRAVRRLDMPTLALLAEKDQIADTPLVEALLTTIPAAEVRTLLGADHSMEFAPTGGLVAQAILEWMGRLSRAKERV